MCDLPKLANEKVRSLRYLFPLSTVALETVYYVNMIFSSMSPFSLVYCRDSLSIQLKPQTTAHILDFIRVYL